MDAQVGEFRVVTVYARQLGPDPLKPWQSTAYVHYQEEYDPVAVAEPSRWFETLRDAEQDALAKGIELAHRLQFQGRSEVPQIAV